MARTAKPAHKRVLAIVKGFLRRCEKLIEDLTAMFIFEGWHFERTVGARKSSDGPRDPAVMSPGTSDPSVTPGGLALLPLLALAATLIRPRNEALLCEARTSALDNRPRRCPRNILSRRASGEGSHFHSIPLNWKALLNYKIYSVACQPRPSHLPTSTIRQLHTQLPQISLARKSKYGSKQSLHFQDL